MSLRIGFDMDGVLADFASAYRTVEREITEGTEGTEKDTEVPEVTEVTEKTEAADAPGTCPRVLRRRRDAVWSRIRATPDFWMTLQPIEPGAVRRIHASMLRHRWDVFFITQRPATAGDTVQRQTQRWLVEQGFDMPSVLAIAGSRGAAAGALKLDYLVDDSPQNCLDVIADSKARPILVAPESDAVTRASARKLKIATAASIAECLDLIDAASSGQGDAGILKRVAGMLGL